LNRKSCSIPRCLSIDTRGNYLFEQNKVRFKERKSAVIVKINAQVRFIK